MKSMGHQFRSGEGCGSVFPAARCGQCKDNRPPLLFLYPMFDFSSREAPLPLAGGDLDMAPDQPHDHAESHASVLMGNLQRGFPNGRKLARQHICKFLVAWRQDIATRDRFLIHNFAVFIRDRNFNVS